MEQTIALDRHAAIPSTTHQAAHARTAERVSWSHKEAARRALLLWSGIDGPCASSDVATSGLFAPDGRCCALRRRIFGQARRC
ncbi:MAG: hypothetical protein M0R73_00795 [Dehalococcoidia bacterium]|nr:hypothetical protein [Dehalococcoidia bacterium]